MKRKKPVDTLLIRVVSLAKNPAVIGAVMYALGGGSGTVVANKSNSSEKSDRRVHFDSTMKRLESKLDSVIKLQQPKQRRNP